MRRALALIVLLAACRRTPAPTAPPQRSVSVELEAAPLPWLAGRVLPALMHAHAGHLAALDAAVLGGDLAAAGAAAHALLAEARLTRPERAGDDTVNAVLPAAFYDLQDVLVAAARALEAAAAAGQRDAVDAAYRDVTATCAACHAAYRRAVSN